ncbi:polyhydroxyalkanoate synthesis repressor PhaR [Humitalea rosea]|uniref:Polyhydroxyalkanoate synthesis repressor PhaR n=1 Tax=Humitalea rosea TaxID=990373 RepID=A0A2W7HWH2_9PROT|nr:polyhydroxyalkanoate synthesis repressor PhaR [Humitalea rosea]PZW39006.1 polyhydroxyalkanoate synthesis repressor PhaR [Humitalea rosea]
MADQTAETPKTNDAEAAAPTPPLSTVVVKKYANRRLYNTESSSYVTLEDLAAMVRAGRDFVVYDAKSGDDITRGVLTQIIVEEEAKGKHLLPESFLRHLIGFYGDSLQGVVPRYLEYTMSAFARQQEQMRQTVQQTIGTLTPFNALEEMGKQNMAMMERAMTLFSPFAGRPDPAATPPARDPLREVELLKAELESLQRRMAQMQTEQKKG